MRSSCEVCLYSGNMRHNKSDHKARGRDGLAMTLGKPDFPHEEKVKLITVLAIQQ